MPTATTQVAAVLNQVPQASQPTAPSSGPSRAPAAGPHGPGGRRPLRAGPGHSAGMQPGRPGAPGRRRAQGAETRTPRCLGWCEALGARDSASRLPAGNPARRQHRRALAMAAGPGPAAVQVPLRQRHRDRPWRSEGSRSLAAIRDTSGAHRPSEQTEPPEASQSCETLMRLVRLSVTRITAGRKNRGRRIPDSAVPRHPDPARAGTAEEVVLRSLPDHDTSSPIGQHRVWAEKHLGPGAMTPGIHRGPGAIAPGLDLRGTR